MLSAATAHAQVIYVSNYADGNHGTVGAYDATSGSSVSTFTSPAGINVPFGLAVSGNNLYIATEGTDYNGVGIYNATNGGAINASLTNDLISPVGVAIAGNNLYVADRDAPSVNEYDATNGGAAANSISFPFGLSNSPEGVAVANNILYVGDDQANTVTAYDATTLSQLSSFVSPGVSSPSASPSPAATFTSPTPPTAPSASTVQTPAPPSFPPSSPA